MRGVTEVGAMTVGAAAGAMTAGTGAGVEVGVEVEAEAITAGIGGEVKVLGIGTIGDAVGVERGVGAKVEGEIKMVTSDIQSEISERNLQRL